MSYIKESRVENSNELIEKNDKITRDWREVFIYAQKIKTSDIHVYQKNNAVIVKMRQSGEMIVTHMYEDRDLINDYFIKLKRISGFRNDTTSKPQSSGFELLITNSRYRAQATPMKGIGEKIVYRVIRDGDLIPLNKMGFSDKALNDLLWCIDQDQGLILVTGPTGSGKSTTLQGAINELNRDRYNVITIEDPIERRINDVIHTEISPEYNWIDAIKCALRSDPDYLLIGEIRDKESAELCLEASQTGHLVFSTLHVSDAPGVVNRLISLGVDREVLAENLLFASSQKFAPKLCHHCKIKNEISNFYKRSSYGCENCNNSGVKGIVVLMEYLFRPPIDSIIQFNKKVFKEKYLKQSFYDDVLRYVKNGEICESYLQKSFVLNE
ncbi:MAG: Flp pilus assembly complex ATPase component TadA [Silvanigrellaceae bacterium]|nr:Flp pilus assembly complex ATPase component TadA [Silvanigrellaceae bacterium]